VLLEIGRIGKAHGIKGEATIEIYTDDPENRFQSGTKVQLSNGKIFEIESAKFHSGTWLISLVGITTRNQIEDLRNEVLLSEVDISDNAENEYHLQQLLDCQVKNLSGIYLGKVVGISKNPGQDLLQVSSGKEVVLVPMVKAIVKEIDLGQRLIKLDPPMGLFPANEEQI